MMSTGNDHNIGSDELHPMDQCTGTDFPSQYDFCIVFPAGTGDFTSEGHAIIRLLLDLGFDLFAYRGLMENELIVLARTPIERMRSFAASIEFSMALDPAVVHSMLSNGDSEAGIAPVHIAHRPDITPFTPYEQLYAKYKRDVAEHLYYRGKEDNVSHPFRSSLRLKLQSRILQTKQPDGAQVVNLERLIAKHVINGCFPLHDVVALRAIEKKWSTYPLTPLPLDEIKEYWGEQIGLYFAFIEHFISYLLLPAVIGVPLQILVSRLQVQKNHMLLRPIFSLFIVLWAVCVLEFWKRKEKTIALRWGTINFEGSEPDRSAFHGEWTESCVDGSKVRYFPTATRRFRAFQSVFAVAAMVLLALGIVACIYIIRYTIQPSIGFVYAQTFASATNTIQIQIMNALFGRLAKWLTTRENHRTDTQYEDNMIAKIFAFQFTNSYASFFYIAFIAEYIGRCPKAGCMWALSLNLMIVFGTRLVVSNWFQLGQPLLAWRERNAKITKITASSALKLPKQRQQQEQQQRQQQCNSDSTLIQHHYQSEERQNLLTNAHARRTSSMTRPEQEYLLDEYDVVSARIGDFGEVAIGFGYVALFLPALPIVATFLYASLVLGVKGDAWKLAHLHRRTFPADCEDIGTWQMVFLVLSITAVVTNAGLIVFTMHELDYLSEHARFWVFIGFQWLCFTLQVFIMEMIPDIPEAIQIQLQRQQFIIKKIIDREPDQQQLGPDSLSNPISQQKYSSTTQNTAAKSEQQRSIAVQQYPF